jgi:hypothetical protein
MIGANSRGSSTLVMVVSLKVIMELVDHGWVMKGHPESG